MLKEALAYRRRNWSLIPMMMDTKRPAQRWKPFQSRQAHENTIRRWFGNGSNFGIGVVFGAVSGGLASRDFDTIASYGLWAAEHPDLAETLMTVETRRGRHVYCQAAPGSLHAVRQALGKVGGTGAIAVEDGELRADVGCYSVLPPSKHPSGFVYRWIQPPGDGSLPTIDLLDAGFVSLTHATERTEVYGDDRGQQRLPKITDAIDECSIESAIARALPTGPGQRHRQVFKLARALKAIPALVDADPRDLKPLVRQWHKAALPFITTSAFEETWIDFLKAWPNVRFPLGSDSMAELLAKVLQMDPPEVARQYEQAELRLLVSLCRELQRAAGEGPFYLACRTAGRWLDVDHSTANRWLFLLVRDGVLAEVSKGGPQTKKASRYRFLVDDGQS
jgi:hypothetical protein